MQGALDVDSTIKMCADVLAESSKLLLQSNHIWQKSEDALLDLPNPDSEKDSDSMEYAVARASHMLVEEYLDVLRCMDANEKASTEIKEVTNAAAERKYEAEACVDLNGILEVYKRPLETPASVVVNNAGRRNPKMKEAIRSYQAFCEKLFKIYDSSATIPHETLIQTQLSFLNSAENNAEEFNDMEIEETVIPVCPLSSRPFEDPVLSLDCKHHYSQKHIMAALENSASVTCPSRGCSRYVNRNRLVRDPFMDIKTQIWKIEQKQKRATETQVMETL